MIKRKLPILGLLALLCLFLAPSAFAEGTEYEWNGEPQLHVQAPPSASFLDRLFSLWNLANSDGTGQEAVSDGTQDRPNVGSTGKTEQWLSRVLSQGTGD